MSDESRLQVTPGSLLSLLRARSGLIARGRRDAAALAGSDSLWSETRRLAEAGDARAQYELGNLYAERYKSAPWGFVRADYEEANKWYRKAAEQGLADAKGKDSESNFKFHPDEAWFVRAVAAEMSAIGLSVPHDLDKAALRWRRAAEQGDSQAQFNLGNMYESGQGVTRNYAESANWYRKAAGHGHARAQLFFAYTIDCGTFGIDELAGPTPLQRSNWPKIAFWLTEAFYQGLGPVWHFVDNASDSGFAYSYPGVVRWEWDEFRNDAEQDRGEEPEQLSLGRIRYHCRAYAEAERLFREAGDQGDGAAQFYLECLLTNGRYSRNDAEAANWYRKAADQGHANAQSKLGEMYHHGWGVSMDYAEAARWYRKAAEQGDANAQFCLGWLLAQGQGALQNGEEATLWYRKAADQGHFPAQMALGRMQHKAIE